MDPLSTTVTICTAISIVTTSVVTLSKVIEGLRKHYKIIQDLWDELTALEAVVLSLQKALEFDPDRFSLLAFPLARCGQACKDFSLVIEKCTVHSDGSRPSIRDWATLKYMGSDISGFLRMLDGYKMTICIALEAVNIRGSQVNVEHIQLYQVMISANVKTLEERITEMNGRLESLAPERYQDVVSDTIERTQMLEERACIQRLIDICLGASQDLEHRQVDIAKTENKFNDSERTRSATQATTRTLEMCRRELTNTSTEIQAELLFSDTKTSSVEWAVPDIDPERQSLERELESLRRQLAICVKSNGLAEQKRQIIFERISAGNQAFQTIASNCGANIVATDVQIGHKTFQALGQFDDITIQQTSQNHTASLAPQVISSGITPRARVDSSLQEQVIPKHESSHLPSQSTSDTNSLKDNIIRSEVRGQTQKHHAIRFKTPGFVRVWGCFTRKSGEVRIGEKTKQG